MASKSRLDLVERIFDNMHDKSAGNYKGGLMLSGDPGTGKTSMIKTLAKMLGMDLIVVEVPHITEELIINIPFVTIHPNGAKEHGDTQMNSKYELILSKSNLFTQLENATKVSDTQYLKHVYGSGNAVIKLFEDMGGSKTQVPTEIEDLRKKFSVILFLDEFYRATSTSIRNMLRDILNNRIGHQTIPSDAYIIYASNMNDEGLDNISMNQQFAELDMDAPNKDEWFEWFINKYKDDKKVKLHPKVIKEFQQAIEEEHLSYNDVESGVRSSPRRWEQVLLYVNASIPPASQKEASALMTNVQAMFKDYETGAKSKLFEGIQKAVEKLITDTSSFSAASNSDENWRDTLEHQIVNAMKLGNSRTYVPVISGAPGIGKAQPLYSKVLTPSGWVTMGNLRIGDLVTAHDGTAVPIVGIFPQGVRDVYAITMSDGRSTDACEDHLWKVKKDRENDWIVVPTSFIQHTLENTKRWTYVPLLSAATALPPAELPIHPYILGALIGDGSLREGGICFSNSDPECLSRFKEVLVDTYTLKHTSNYDYRLVRDKNTTVPNYYTVELRKLGLVGKLSYAKFIPTQYLDNTNLEQKLELIRGLLDTDGYVSKTGAISYSTSSHQLAKDVQTLVWSIGGICKITERNSHYTYKGERLPGRQHYCVSIRYRNPKDLLFLNRKKDRISSTYQYSDLKLRITSVVLKHRCEVQCIMVDHPDHLYITDDYIVTHNTAEVAKIAHSHDLRLIDIDTSRLSPDDVIGLPLPGDQTKTGMNVNFSKPPLLSMIEKQIEKHDAAHVAGLSAEEKKAYQSKEWKYLIFFDEMNRASVKTFNAVRRVLLERDFGHGMPIPAGSILIGAINPKDIGTSQFTSHVKDVLDVIDAKPSWTGLMSHLKVMKLEGSEAVKDSALNILKAFVTNFKSRGHGDIDGHFMIGLPDDVYISPREYSDLYVTLVRGLNRAAKKNMIENITQYKEYIFSIFSNTLGFILTKHQIDKVQPLSVVKQWFMTSDEIGIGYRVKSAMSSENANFSGYFADPRKLIDDQHIINFSRSATDVDFINHITQTISSQVHNVSDVKGLLKPLNQIITLEDDKLEYSAGASNTIANFFLGVIYTLHLHGLDNRRLQSARKSMTSACQQVISKHSGDTEKSELMQGFSESIMQVVTAMRGLSDKG